MTKIKQKRFVLSTTYLYLCSVIFCTNNPLAVNYGNGLLFRQAQYGFDKFSIKTPIPKILVPKKPHTKLGVKMQDTQITTKVKEPINRFVLHIF
jgi:hypothetical protein